MKTKLKIPPEQLALTLPPKTVAPGLRLVAGKKVARSAWWMSQSRRDWSKTETVKV